MSLPVPLPSPPLRPASVSVYPSLNSRMLLGFAYWKHKSYARGTAISSKQAIKNDRRFSESSDFYFRDALFVTIRMFFPLRNCAMFSFQFVFEFYFGFIFTLYFLISTDLFYWFHFNSFPLVFLALHLFISIHFRFLSLASFIAFSFGRRAIWIDSIAGINRPYLEP